MAGNSPVQVRHLRSDAYSAEQVLVNSVDQLRHTRSVAYSVKLDQLNKQQISGGGADLHCYPSSTE